MGDLRHLEQLDKIIKLLEEIRDKPICTQVIDPGPHYTHPSPYYNLHWPPIQITYTTDAPVEHT